MRLRLCILLLLCSSVSVFAQSRDEKVRNDRVKFEKEGFWIYHDLAKAKTEAEKSGKPIIAVLRCIPCEECVKLDDEIVDNDQRLRPLLEKFVRVRIVANNGLDLATFQFDTDQSFAVFFMRPDGTIYGRFGTRSDRTHWTDDVSIDGLVRALEATLKLHEEFPKHRVSLAAKRGPAPDFPSPEKYPKLAGRFESKLAETGNVVKSCIHCHQVGEAQRDYQREKTGALTDEILFPYPHPKSIGLILDPRECATVLRAEPNTPAARAGFQPGDKLIRLAGQPLVSIADVQWVLQGTAAGGAKLPAEIDRGGKLQTLTLALPNDWRKADDIAWRASSWELRRMSLGGIFSKPLSAEERSAAKIPENAIGLKIHHVGKYAPHDVAHRAGFQQNDVILSFNDRDDIRRETDLLRYALNDLKPGTKVPVKLRRGDREQTLVLPIPGGAP